MHEQSACELTRLTSTLSWIEKENLTISYVQISIDVHKDTKYRLSSNIFNFIFSFFIFAKLWLKDEGLCYLVQCINILLYFLDMW